MDKIAIFESIDQRRRLMVAGAAALAATALDYADAQAEDIGSLKSSNKELAQRGKPTSWGR